ncbi:MAG: S-layer family protein, partial [Actinobacteria bacterium]|nr:S-layer family protein [Actinomycetota bacterium]
TADATNITFSGNVTATSFTTATQGYNVVFNGASNTITNAVTFSNTGSVTLGNGSDTIAFTGGVTATAPSSINLNGTVTAAGTGVITLGDSNTGISVGGNSTVGGTSTGNITLGAATLADGVTLTVGTGIANTLSLSSVSGTASGTSSNLTINTTGAATISGAVGTDIGTVTVTQSGGTTFSSTVDAATVTLTATTGSITFNGALTATTLNTAASGYNLVLNAGGTITDAVAFANTGSVTLGNESTDSITFTGGITATTPSQVNIAGTVQTTNNTISIGDSNTATVLTANTTISSGTAGLTLGGTVNGAFALTLNTTGTTTLSSTIGNSTALASITTNSGGTVAINGGAITTTGTQTYNDAVTLGAATTLTTTNSNVTFNGTLNSYDTTARNLTLSLGSGTLVVGDSTADTVGATNPLGAISITGALDLNAAITSATSLSVSGASDLGANVTTSGTQTYSGAVTLSTSNTLTTTSNGNISFGSTVNGDTTGRTLSVTTNGTGDTTFTGTVGGTNELGNITINTDVLSAAAIKLAGTLSITNTGTSSITGIISDGATAASLTKAGAGELTLSGANTYTGVTTISVGTLKVNNATALGASSSGVSITSGAVLDLNGITMTNTNALTINGTGISSGGALINSSSTGATYAGAISLGSNSSIGGTGSIQINGIVSGSTYALTIVNSGNVTATNSSNTVANLTITNSAINLYTSVALTINASTLNKNTTIRTIGSASDILITGAISDSTGLDTLLLKSSRDIYLASSASINGTTAKPLTVTMYSDTDNSGGGAIAIIGSMNSYGGNITMAGGTNDPDSSNCASTNSCTNGYASASGISRVGGALGTNPGQQDLGTGVLLANDINAGGGNILIKGLGNSSNSVDGNGVELDAYSGGSGNYVGATAKTIQTSGAGTISITAIGTGTWNGFINFAGNISAGTGLISISGSTTSTNNVGAIRFDSNVANLISSSGPVSISASGVAKDLSLRFSTGFNLTTSGDITINAINTGAGYGLIATGSSSSPVTIKSTSGSVSITGSSANKNGIVFIPNGSDTESKVLIESSTDLTINGISSGSSTSSSSSGLILGPDGSSNTSSGYIKSNNGNIVINGISSGYVATYIHTPISATNGSVTISGAGYGGVYIDSNSGDVDALTDINIIGYATSLHGMSVTTSNTLTATNGNISLSGVTAGGASYKGINGTSNITATNGAIIFQGATLSGNATPSGTLISNAINVGTPSSTVYAQAGSAATPVTNGTTNSGIAWTTGTITAYGTNGYVSINAVNPTIASSISTRTLLMVGTGQSYTLTLGTNFNFANTTTAIAASVGSGNITINAPASGIANLIVGSAGGVTGINANDVSLAASGWISIGSPTIASGISASGNIVVKPGQLYDLEVYGATISSSGSGYIKLGGDGTTNSTGVYFSSSSAQTVSSQGGDINFYGDVLIV